MTSMREWLVIEDSMANAVFATEEQRTRKGYIPRDVAEALLGRSMGGTVWFTAQESAALRRHPDYRTQLSETCDAP
jgi:hypothetical protein